MIYANNAILRRDGQAWVESPWVQSVLGRKYQLHRPPSSEVLLD